MEIEIRLFATFREYLPEGSGTFSFKKTIHESTTVGDIIKELGLPLDMPKIVIVKGSQVKEDSTLQDGDVVSIFPPMAGG